jgi:hypothetical protein
MVTRINPPHPHVYRRIDDKRCRLLISQEVNSWEARLVKLGDEFPGANCVFFSEDGGTSWNEFYLLSFLGNRSAEFSAFVLNPRHGIPRIINGAGGEVEFVNRDYELVDDEKLSFTNVTYLDANDRLRIGDSDAYERLRRNFG